MRFDDWHLTIFGQGEFAPLKTLKIIFSGFIMIFFLPLLLIAQAQTAGSLDATFDGDGKATLDVDTFHNEASAVAVQPDGKIVAAGNNVSAAPDAIILARFTNSGSLDASFGNAGVVSLELGEDSCKIRSIAIQPDGKILLAGNKGVGLSSSDFLVMRFNPNGTLDLSFDADGWTTTSFSHNDIANAIAVQPDGKIVVAGQANREFEVYQTDFVLARYNADGSLDTGFDSDGKLTTPFGELAAAYSVAVQTDGKIVAAGDNRLTVNTTTADFAVIRYHANGAIDSSFGVGGKVITRLNNRHSSSRAIAILPDGKILLGGETRGAANNLDFALARFNADGSLDTTFGTNGGVSTDIAGRDDFIGETRSLAVQSDGKIVLVGTSVMSGDNRDFGLARYNSNGTPDTTFGAGGKITTDFGSPGDIAAAVTVQPDGKIVAIGKAMITFVNGTNLRYFDFALARYNSGTIAAPLRTRFDFDGDGRADISVYRNGNWYIQQSTAGFTAPQFGLATDKLAPADYDGDGKTDLGVYRDGTWYLLRSSQGFAAVQFGVASDIPQTGDFDGDAKADLAVFRPSDGVWYLLNSQTGFSAAQFGQNGDKPVASDFDSDGKADLAVYRPADGTWYVLQSRDGFRAIQFGIASDKPVVGDYDGDGKSDFAVYRDGVWYLQRSQTGFAAIQFGTSSDIPAPADYDGDRKTDIAVFRNGVWYLQQSASGFAAAQFGLANDIPIPSAFVP